MNTMCIISFYIEVCGLIQYFKPIKYCKGECILFLKNCKKLSLKKFRQLVAQNYATLNAIFCNNP
jgi:hypothetical protein